MNRRQFLLTAALTGLAAVTSHTSYPSEPSEDSDYYKESQTFDNNASQVLFIGKRNLATVIAEDTKELKRLRGSFDAIGDRMDKITDFAEKLQSFPVDYDRKVQVISYMETKGMQECPFDRGSKCRIRGYGGWSEIVKIKSKKTGRQLTINSGTAHLARVHHLLEKDNEYGISAREFYESFM